MQLEDNIFPRNIKGIEKGLEIYGFGMSKYSIRSGSGSMIALRYHAYCVRRLPKDLQIIFSQGIFTSEIYKGTFIAYCCDEHDSYEELNLKENKTGWHKA